MASVGMSGAFKPLGPSRIRMDTSQAMAIMGFPSSQAFEHTSISEVESAFMFKVHLLEVQHVGNKHTKKAEARRLNEALQFLIRKRRRLSGRSMQTNWQLLSGKSNTANDVISLIHRSTGLAAEIKSSQQTEDEKKAEKRRQELAKIEADKKLREQSKAARELAAELTSTKKPKGAPQSEDTIISSSISVARQLSQPTAQQQQQRKSPTSHPTVKQPKRTLANSSSSRSSVKGPKVSRGSSKKSSIKTNKTETLSPAENGTEEKPKRASVTGISDDEDFADDLIPSPPRRVSSAGANRRTENEVDVVQKAIKTLGLEAQKPSVKNGLKELEDDSVFN